jgi:predicted nucleic acid-binding protein
MAVKIFLDANVLLDFALKRKNHKEAKDLFELIRNNDVKAFITSSVLHITSYWLSKAYGTDKTKELLLALLEEITVIDIPHETALIALHSKISDIEDALQYYAAIHHKLDYFISSDKQLKKDCIAVLPVYTPADFIAAFGKI